MGLMSHIDLAPKNGDFIILRDLRSGSWEVGRWAQESGSWVQIDGKPLRLFPTHWAPVSDDPAGSTDRERLSFLVTSKWPRARFILVARFSQIEGYRCLSLIRALGVVNCQLALVWLALRSCSQAAISSMRVCLSGMRRSRHWDDRTPSSDSARSSQLPCFGV